MTGWFVSCRNYGSWAIEAGLPPEKVKITGNPVRPELAAGAQDKTSLRLSQRWQPDLFTVLAIGSKRAV